MALTVGVGDIVINCIYLHDHTKLETQGASSPLHFNVLQRLILNQLEDQGQLFSVQFWLCVCILEINAFQ